MNARVMARQQAQMAFVASGENLVVGSEVDCPLPPDELAALTPDSSLVVEQFGGGLTARVLHLQIDGKHYTLKQKRHEALVRNVDGETSFLNEVQRRADFTRLKSDPVWEGRFAHIVPTLYADFRRGIILSPWLEGKPLDRFDGEIFEQILATAIACEEAGLMEWDLCPGNIIDDNGFIWFFDFGYMYPFDPCCEFNSNGLSDPLFHACERFETRNFFLPVTLCRGLRGLRFWTECPIIEPVLISYHYNVLILQEALCSIWITLPTPLWTRRCCNASAKLSGATRAMPMPTIRQALPQRLL
jgi:hypothetical protein